MIPEISVYPGKPIVWDQNYIGVRDNPYFDEVDLSSTQTGISLKSFTICTKHFKMVVKNDDFLIRPSKVKTLDKVVRIGDLRNASGLCKLNNFLKDINYHCNLFYFMT